LHRQVGWLLALENPAGVSASQAIVLRKIASIAHQAACLDEPAILKDRGHRVAERERGELFAPRGKEWIVADHEPAGSQLEQGRKDRIKVAFGARVQDMEFEPKAAGRRLHFSRLCLGSGSVRIDERSNDLRCRDQLVQQLQPLRA
jgi:hypothetical protein